MTTAKVIGYAFLALLVIYGLGFLATGGDLMIYKFWAPKQAAAERQVFEQTPSFVHGKIEYLTRLRFEYQTATGAQKLALAQLILDEASTVDNSKLPLDLQAFISTLKGGL
jgi:hypothetical protein